MMRVSNVLTQSTKVVHFVPPWLRVTVKSQASNRSRLGDFLVRLPPEKFRPRKYANFKIQLACPELATLKLYQQTFRHDLPLNEEANFRLGRDDDRGEEDRRF